MVTFLPSFSFWADWSRSFSFKKMPSPRWVNSLQCDAATPILHCRDGVCWGMGRVRFVPHLEFWILSRSSIFVSSYPKTLYHILAGSPWCLLANLRRGLMWFFFNNGFFLATHQYRPVVYRTLDVNSWCFFTTVSATELCSAFKVIVGLSVASVMCHLLALYFEGRPCLGSAWVAWCFQLPFLHIWSNRAHWDIENTWTLIRGLFWSIFSYLVHVYKFISNFLELI